MTENSQLPVAQAAPATDADVPPEPPFESEGESPPGDEAPPRRGLFAILAFLWWLLIALGALGAFAGVGWLYWERYQGIDPAAREIASLSSRLEQLQRHLGELTGDERRTVSSIAELRDEMHSLEQDLDTLGVRVRREIAELRDAGPPSERDWRLAEVEYLLRIANIRLRMERDARGALRLLRSADDLLAELDDFALLDVRKALAEDIARVAEVPALDTEGLFLALQALEDGVGRLPLSTDDFTAARQAQPERPAPQGVLERIASELGRMVSIRTDLDRPEQPVLTVKEAWYVEQNLRLHYEQAQIALLRASDPLYHESLKAARQWVRDYYDADSDAVKAVLARIDELDAIRLTADVPDISGSLNTLRALRAKQRAGA